LSSARADQGQDKMIVPTAHRVLRLECFLSYLVFAFAVNAAVDRHAVTMALVAMPIVSPFFAMQVAIYVPLLCGYVSISDAITSAPARGTSRSAMEKAWQMKTVKQQADCRRRSSIERFADYYGNTKHGRKSLTRGISNDLCYPSSWTAPAVLDQEECLDGGAVLVTLGPEMSEYKEVRAEFQRTSSRTFNIVSIKRVQNCDEYEQWALLRRQLRRLNCDVPIKEMRLWHGTSKSNIDKIMKFGFNRSFTHRAAYGKGVYFASAASYSQSDSYSKPDAKQHKYLLFCRVLTGDFAAGSSSMVAPPERKDGLQYHSVVDSMQKPSIFVIFKDHQAFPEYLVEFCTHASASI